MNLCVESHQLCRYIRNVLYTQRRFRVKRKWASTQQSKTPQEYALQYFDKYYKPLYGERWPSVRLALLSQQKYCAVVNNFGAISDTCIDLMCAGADDVIGVAHKMALKRQRRREQKNLSSHTDDDDETSADSMIESHRHGDDDIATPPMPPTSTTISPAFTVPGESPEDEDDGQPIDHSNLYDFMPVKRIYSDKEELEREDAAQGHYRPATVDISVYPDEAAFRLPEDLRAFIYPRGDVSLFPSPSKGASDKLNYYVMNAASILPVLALDVQPDSNVLDLCAAPGGKSLTILQILDKGSVTCVDHSYSRLQRLRHLLRWYMPYSHIADKTVRIVHNNAIKLIEDSRSHAMYDRVLVDVPCYMDRHVLQEEENNIFRPIRTTERLQIQQIQRELLIAAIHCCKPGGVVVYSTCTLAPAQNDGVIAATLEQLWCDTRIDVNVQDTRHLATTFRNTFDFASSTTTHHSGAGGACRFGQLVVPNLLANCGPMYVCKLKRLN